MCVCVCVFVCVEMQGSLQKFLDTSIVHGLKS